MNRAWRFATLSGLVAFLCCLQLPAYDLPISGTLSQRYKFRTTGDLKDNDIETIVTADLLRTAETNYSASLQAGGIFDLDRTAPTSPFSSVYDTIDNHAVGRLYYAWLNLYDTGPANEIRIGRQHRYEFESLYFDGVHFESESYAGFRLNAFGGVPVHLFENQTGFDLGDWLAGGAIQWDPLAELQIRFDYAHLKDEVQAFRASTGDREDNLLGGTLWWSINDDWTLTSRLTSFSDQVRDAEARLRVQWLEWALRSNLYVTRLFQGYDVRVIEWDAFGTAGTFVPFTEGGFDLTKDFGDYWNSSGGFSIRLLDDNQIASAFNHGFERLFFTLLNHDLIWEDLSLSATADYYHGEDNTLRNDSLGGSFEASKHLWRDRILASAGTGYFLYRFNLFSGNESTNVQTYFAKIRAKLLSSLKGEVGYTLEDNNLNNFHEVDLKLNWSF